MNAQIMKPEVFEKHRCATIIEKNCKLFNHFIEDVSSGAHSKKAPHSKQFWTILIWTTPLKTRILEKNTFHSSNSSWNTQKMSPSTLHYLAINLLSILCNSARSNHPRHMMVSDFPFQIL